MGGIAASIGAWLLKSVTGDFLGKVLKIIAGTDSGAVRLEEIAAEIEIAQGKNHTELAKALIAARAQSQAAKMNWPVFWVLIVAMMGPPIFLLWGVGLYNVLWHEHGIWPMVHRGTNGQLIGWWIEDFPPSIKPWAQAAIDWLFDPLGPPSGIGAALVAGRLGRR